MALSRSFLKGMQLTDEQVSAIIEAHTESTDALKAQRDEYKEKAEKLSQVEKELSDLKNSGDDWKGRYEKEHTEFEAYKTDREAKDVQSAKENAFTKVLRGLGISEKVVDKIIKLSGTDGIELDEKGSIKDEDKLIESVKKDWDSFIPTQETHGASTQTPPGSGTGSAKTKEEILAIKNPGERQKAILENHELFGY